jgi:hypothetical protein
MSALGNRIATYLADMEARKPDGRTFHAMHPEVLLREAMDAIQRTEEAADKLRQERDEWKLVAGYEAGDPEDAAIVKRAIERASNAETALKSARQQALDEAASTEAVSRAVTASSEIWETWAKKTGHEIDLGNVEEVKFVAVRFAIEAALGFRELAQEAGT